MRKKHNSKHDLPCLFWGKIYLFWSIKYCFPGFFFLQFFQKAESQREGDEGERGKRSRRDLHLLVDSRDGHDSHGGPAVLGTGKSIRVFQMGRQGPKYLSHHLLPSQLREQEAESEVDIKAGVVVVVEGQVAACNADIPMGSTGSCPTSNPAVPLPVKLPDSGVKKQWRWSKYLGHCHSHGRCKWSS